MAEMDGVLQIRSEVLAFLGIPDDTVPGQRIFRRMQGFTVLSTSKNPLEYSRQYVDEPMEQSDVTGYSPSIAFGYDRYVGNLVHDYMSEIIDNELIGSAAVVWLLSVDSTKEAGEDNAVLRPYSLIADTEGDQLNAYTHSGNLRVKGTKTWGEAVIAADGLTATFTPS
jgi:hypothetical protein